MAEMHASLQRLYEVANASTGKKLTPKELADELNESPQTITNWADRGVSLPGALKVEAKYGAPAVYVLGAIDGIAPGWLNPGAMLDRLAGRQAVLAIGSQHEPATEPDLTLSSSDVSEIHANLDEPEKQLFVRLLLAAGFKLPGVNVEVELWERKDKSGAQPRLFSLDPHPAPAKPVKPAKRASK